MRKIKDVVVYQDDGYNSFPTAAIDKNGDVYVAFRHAPDRRGEYNGIITHVDPNAVAYLVRSTDDGKTFGPPQTIYGKDNRSVQDPCVTVLKNGDILVTTFFWQLVDKQTKSMLKEVLIHNLSYSHDIYDGRTSYIDGTYSMISRDNGKSFDGPYLIERGYGCRGQSVQLPNGTILAPLYGYKGGDKTCRVVLYSSQDGVNWRPYSFVWKDAAEKVHMHEPGLFRTAEGTLICLIRTPETLWVIRSADDGLTWSEPEITDIPGNVPFHALQLQSGNVLLTYGLRQKPFGIRGMLLDGELSDIRRSREFVIREDGLGVDISYNGAVQLPSGEILAVYYYYTEEFEQRRHIAGTWLAEE